MSQILDLDAALGRKPAEVVEEKPAETTEVVDTQEVEEVEKPVEEQPKEVEKEEVVQEAEQKPVEQEPEPSEVDLSEVFLEINGKELSVAEAITQAEAENKELSERIAKYESDPWLKNFIEQYHSGGDVEKYISTKIDWDKKDDMTVLRTAWDKENPDLDDAVKDKVFKRDFINKYGFDPYDDGEVDKESDDFQIGQSLIKRDANKARSGFKEEQQKYVIAKPEIKQAPQPNIEEFKNQVLSDKDVKSFKESKLVKLGVKTDDGESYGYEADDPESTIEMMWNNDKFWELFVDQKSKRIDYQKLAKVFTIAKDPDKYESQIFDWGKQAGVESKVKEAKNIDGIQNKTVVPSKKLAIESWGGKPVK